MGKYINRTSDGTRLKEKHKAAAIINDGGQLLFDAPKVWEEGLVCVVDNGFFEAAAYAYNQSELEAFQDPSDDRPKVWLKWDKAKDLASD